VNKTNSYNIFFFKFSSIRSVPDHATNAIDENYNPHKVKLNINQQSPHFEWISELKLRLLRKSSTRTKFRERKQTDRWADSKMQDWRDKG